MGRGTGGSAGGGRGRQGDGGYVAGDGRALPAAVAIAVVAAVHCLHRGPGKARPSRIRMVILNGLHNVQVPRALGAQDLVAAL